MITNYDIYTIYDEPVPYKNLLVYPATMREYLQFMTVAQVILLDKNSIPDPNVISMSHFEYIFYAATDENYYITFLDGLLRISLKIGDENLSYDIDEKGRPLFKIDENIYNKNDFEELRKIIIEQNLLNPPDDSIQKSLRDDMEEAQRLKRKLSGNKTAGIEEQMIALSVNTGIPLDDIYNMTIRKFTKSLERLDHTIHYKVYLAASMSGFVTFKDKSALKHWLADLTQDKFGGMMEYNDFQKKVGGAVE